jgi:hypothetical protein
MRNAALLLLVIVLIGLAGCSTGPKFSYENRKVSIITSPPGAKVYQLNSTLRNETFLGTTPIIDQPVRILTEVRGELNPSLKDWMVSQITMLNVKIVKDGYREYEGNLATHPSKTSVHEITLDSSR